MYKRGIPPILIVLIFSIIAALASGIAVYYYSVGKSQVDKKKVEEELENLKKEYEKIKVENEQLKGTAQEGSELASWKTYNNSSYGFQIKYPLNWIYKDDYETKDYIAFASQKSDLPKLQSGQSAGISIKIESPISDKERTSSPEKIKKEKVTLKDGTKATKVTLLPGRPNDPNGDSKVVNYEILLSGMNKNLILQNINDYEVQVFEKMLQVLSFNK